MANFERFSAVSKPMFASKYSFELELEEIEKTLHEIYKICKLLRRSELEDSTKQT